MQTITPRDLFFDQLRDIHSVEAQLKKSLPTLLARSPHATLAALIARHADETGRQLEVTASILQANGIEVGDDRCRAMEGLIGGGDSHLDGVMVPETRDLMMVAHCLRIEHYEIAAYTVTLRLGEQLGFTEEAGLLKEILQEEESAAAQLHQLEPALFERAARLVRL